MSSKIILICLPLATSTLYLLYRHIHTIPTLTTPYLRDPSIPLPPDVRENLGRYILHHETVCKTLPCASPLPGEEEEGDILTTFLRHSMSTFSHSLAGWGIWCLLSSHTDKRTFKEAYIRALDFVPGERVCGVYVVSSRSPAKVTLNLDMPEGYAGAKVDGMLVVEVREEGGEVGFVNHTVMWREEGRGVRGALETGVGRWVHGIMAGRLVKGGVRGVMGGKEGRVRHITGNMKESSRSVKLYIEPVPSTSVRIPRPRKLRHGKKAAGKKSEKARVPLISNKPTRSDLTPSIRYVHRRKSKLATVKKASLDMREI